MLPNILKLFGFQICWPWMYLMKVIPETRRAHWIWYLRFYYSYKMKIQHRESRCRKTLENCGKRTKIDTRNTHILDCSILAWYRRVNKKCVGYTSVSGKISTIGERIRHVQYVCYPGRAVKQSKRTQFWWK